MKRNRQGVLECTPHAVCTGCRDFSCVRELDTLETLPDHLKWMEDHKMFRGRKCAKHPDAIQKTDVCQQWIKKGQQCRRALSLHAPFFHSKSKIGAKETLMTIERLCAGSTMKTMKKDLHLGKNTLTEVIRKMSASCLWESQVHSEKFTKCAVDETYFGKRKYYRGRRTRARGAWFMSCTEILPDGSSGRTYWCAVRKVDRESAFNFIMQHIVGPRSTVYTDSAAIYKTLGDYCRHAQVNHTIEWKSEAGVHTNHAEGAHGVVKKFMRMITTTYGKGAQSLEERVALATTLFGVPDPKARLQYLLQIAKRHWGDPPNYVSSSDGEQDEALECEEGEEEEIIFDEDDEKQQNDNDNDGDSDAPLADEESDDVDSLAAFGEAEVLRRMHMRAACVGGAVIPSDVVMMALQEEGVPAIFLPCPIPKGNVKRKLANAPKFAVVMMYDDHFMGIVVDKPAKYLNVYDSNRRLNPEARVACTLVCKDFVKSLTGRWCRHRVKHAEHACVRGSEQDCGVHTVNMLLSAMGVVRAPYHRVSLAALVVEPAVEAFERSEEEED